MSKQHRLPKRSVSRWHATSSSSGGLGRYLERRARAGAVCLTGGRHSIITESFHEQAIIEVGASAGAPPSDGA